MLLPYTAPAFRSRHSGEPLSSLVTRHLGPVCPEVVKRLTALTGPGGDHGTFRPRTRVDVARFARWRPDRSPQPAASIADTAMYGAVARLI
jgi:hypothetical protein